MRLYHTETCYIFLRCEPLRSKNSVLYEAHNMDNKNWWWKSNFWSYCTCCDVLVKCCFRILNCSWFGWVVIFLGGVSTWILVLLKIPQTEKQNQSTLTRYSMIHVHMKITQCGACGQEHDYCTKSVPSKWGVKPHEKKNKKTVKQATTGKT